MMFIQYAATQDRYFYSLANAVYSVEQKGKRYYANKN